MTPVATLPPAARTALRGAGVLLAVLWLAYVVQAAFGLGDAGVDTAFGTWVYLTVMIAATAGTASRALLVPADRLAWALLAAGLGTWTGGDLLWAVHFNAATHVPTPSVADFSYYLDYPLTAAGLALLMRAHLHAPRRVFWLDGLTVGLAASAAVAAVVFARIAASATGGTASVVTTLGYPVLDLVLLCLARLAIGLTGWRPGRAWAIFGGYLVLMVVADTVYSYREAAGLGTGVVSTLWPGGALLLAVAAWQDWTGRATNDGQGTIVVPALGALTALSVLVYAALARTPQSRVAVVIAAVALVAVLIRAWLSYDENRTLLARSRRDALTDGLTGLANRRALLTDLDAALTGPRDRRLVFCDLDGFKLYNDTFGHLAGDALLTRLAARLQTTAAGRGAAYRLGGDEFCVIVDGTVRVDEIATALTENGEGFSIEASIGVVELPADAATAERALQLADERMYTNKTSRRPSSKRHARDLLVQILSEREPALSDHTREVAGYAVSVARTLGLTGEALDEIARAAELHDVGKVAVPDRVLYGTSELSDADWKLLHAAPVVGERILASHPALRPVARIVRSCREHWQGDGYPDQLAKSDIPIGARIIAVCDAYDAMLAERPHRSARTSEDALQEVCEHAGTRFDPDVVAAFVEVVTTARPVPAPRASAALL